MVRGGDRRSKPSKIRELHGNPGKRAVNEQEPKPQALTGTIEPPSGLGTYGKRLWSELAPRLQRLEVLTETDLPAFEALCYAWERYTQARRRLSRVDRTLRRVEKSREITDPEKQLEMIERAQEVLRRAEVSVEKAEQSYRMLGASFGLEPASRARLQVGSGDNEVDPFEQWERGVS